MVVASPNGTSFGDTRQMSACPKDRALLPTATLSVILMLAACDNANVKPGDKNYPVKNSSPQHFMSLHGTMDPSLEVGFRIHWTAHNPDCRYATSLVEGAYANFTASDALNVTHEGTSFFAFIATDGVLPGRCDWKFSGISYSWKSGYRTFLIQTNSYPLKPGQSPNGIVQLYCKLQPTGSLQMHELTLVCRWPSTEDRQSSVSGGTLWWHPETKDVEVHFNLDSSN
jgi:hypothetical protein